MEPTSQLHSTIGIAPPPEEHLTLTRRRIPMPEEQPTLTVDETAELTRLGRSTVYAGVQSGEIPSIRIGRRILVPTAGLRRMLGLDDA